MKKILSMLLVMTLLLAVSAYAVVPRTIDVLPDITFNGTKADCSVRITGDYLTDTISATMTLKYGSTVIASWSDSGSGILKMEESATVELNKTYTLTVAYSVNGVTKTPVTITRTNS